MADHPSGRARLGDPDRHRRRRDPRRLVRSARGRVHSAPLLPSVLLSAHLRHAVPLISRRHGPEQRTSHVAPRYASRPGHRRVRVLLLRAALRDRGVAAARGLRGLRGDPRRTVGPGDGHRVAHPLRATPEGARGDAARSVHAGGEDRRGRHGRRLPRHALDAAPARGDQAPPARSRRAEGPRALRAGSPANEPPRAPEHDRHLRLRPQRRRRLLLRDGVSRRLRSREARRFETDRWRPGARFTCSSRRAERSRRRTRSG